MTNMRDLVLKTPQELQKLAVETRAQIRDLRFKIATRQHAKVRMMRNAKRDLARMLTALRKNRS